MSFLFTGNIFWFRGGENIPSFFFVDKQAALTHPFIPYPETLKLPVRSPKVWGFVLFRRTRGIGGGGGKTFKTPAGGLLFQSHLFLQRGMVILQLCSVV